MQNLTEISKTDLMEKYERARNAIKSARVHGKRVGRLFVDASLCAGAGVADGFLQARHPTLMSKDAGLVVGTAIVGLAMAEVFDGMEREALAFGGTLLGCGLSRMTQHAIADHDAKAK